jgi:hypothetical protein
MLKYEENLSRAQAQAKEQTTKGEVLEVQVKFTRHASLDDLCIDKSHVCALFIIPFFPIESFG